MHLSRARIGGSDQSSKTSLSSAHSLSSTYSFPNSSEIFNRFMAEKNYTFVEMSYGVMMHIHEFGENIEQATIKNFYNNNTCNSSIINDMDMI
ncbi:hypothetical protein Glove_85g78 [Diversispora epigaea]|uniref:Uncharacterized protein n=1 Tax=Diversispora epigaea TaxID=1348612 RepID=A0A397J6X5_9GLOM|nr:hypothetical protein Glove_85g78 [Diversispora epigaea]